MTSSSSEQTESFELPPAASAASLSRSRRERTLPLPFVSPRVRSRLLLDEAMSHNWKLHGEAFRRFVRTSGMNQQQQQETFEMVWFRFRMEWRQLYADALAEVDSIEPPQLTGDAALDYQLLAEYQQESTAAFYPVVMMELFQKEVTFDQSVDKLATTTAAPGEQLTAGSRCHWAQLYAHEIRTANPVQPMLLSFPTKREPLDAANAKSYDDLSSVGGFSDNSSFASGSHSPSPSAVEPDTTSTPRAASPTATSTPSQRLQVLLRMASTEAPTAPIDYNAVKYDADVRNGIVSGRRERMKTVLSAVS